MFPQVSGVFASWSYENDEFTTNANSGIIKKNLEEESKL